MAYIGTSSADKGGTGKTTTEINLSACLASRGLDTLLIDYTHQGNATYGLGVRKYKKSLYDVLRKGVPLKEILVQPYPEQLPHLWLAPSDISIFDVADTYDYYRDPYVLARAIAPIWGDFDHIRIDIPGSVLGFHAYTAYSACDVVNITIQPGPFEIRGAKTLVNVLREIKENINPRVRLLKVLMTQTRDTAIAGRVMNFLTNAYSQKEDMSEDELSEALRVLYEYDEIGEGTNPLFSARIRLNAMFQWDQTYGVPAILNPKNRWGIHDYNQFTDEYLRLCAIRPAGSLIVDGRPAV